jgi:hypothetical protein
MKKALLAGLFFLLLSLMAVSTSVGEPIKYRGWIFTTTYWDTGWQTYKYTAGPAGFTGYAGFVAADIYAADVILLIDNLSQCGQPGNEGFEFGNYAGYILHPQSNGTVTTGPIEAVWGVGNNDYPDYYPVSGQYMSYQCSNIDPADMFTNAYGKPGKWGSILETQITLAPYQTFTFDWAFIPYVFTESEDFAKFFLRDNEGNIVFQAGLAQMGLPSDVPLPTSVLLFGPVFLGLFGCKLFRKR